jgi:hypothetical protein
VRVGAETKQGVRGSIDSFGLILSVAAVFAFLLLVLAPGAAQAILSVQASTPTELIAHVVSVMIGAEGFAPAALLWLAAGVGVYVCQRSARKISAEPEFRARLETARLERVRAEQNLIGGDGGLVVGIIDHHAQISSIITSERPVNDAAALALSALAAAAKRVSLSTTQSSSSLRLLATA